MKTVGGEITVSPRKNLRTEKRIKNNNKKHGGDCDILLIRSAVDDLAKKENVNVKKHLSKKQIRRQIRKKIYYASKPHLFFKTSI
jgi:hypothetical protein